MKAEITLKKLKKRQNTNWAVSVYDEKLYFCKNAQTTHTCSVAILLSNDSGHLNELNHNNSVSSLTQQVGSLLQCSELSSLSNFYATLGNLVASRLKAVNNCSFFQIQLGIWHFHP